MARILVSDDDPQVLRLVGLCLEHAGHDVVQTSDPNDVTDLASANAFDAIVLDVMMPGKDGFEVLSELRNNPSTSSIPILFLSGRAGGEDRVRGLREGADDFLAKPFEPEELELRIERLIAWSARGSASDATLPPDGVPPGAQTMGRYEVRGVIGQGTMGTVYRGWDPRLQRAVALKTIRLDSIITEGQRREMLNRLQNEAVTVARFNHPNIVGVYDMGDTEDTAFMAMELVEGVSLARYMRKVGAVRIDKLIPLAAGMSRGLEAAHARLVIHRDVKPQNVLLGRDGAIKMTDFGVAHVVSKSSGEAQQLYGTPGFVPPEALSNEPYTHAGDLFGFGATIYEALAGVHPLVGANIRETIRNTLEGEIRPIRERVPEAPDTVADLITRLLDRDPEQRPTAGEAAELLAEAAADGAYTWSAEDLPADLLPDVPSQEP